jgi:hypothetical protein
MDLKTGNIGIDLPRRHAVIVLHEASLGRATSTLRQEQSGGLRGDVGSIIGWKQGVRLCAVSCRPSADPGELWWFVQLAASLSPLRCCVFCW